MPPIAYKEGPDSAHQKVQFGQTDVSRDTYFIIFF